MIRISPLRPAVAAALIAFLAAPRPAPAAAPPSRNSAISGVFATETTADAPGGRRPAGAAAVVDGHVIPLKDVLALCLREDRSYVVDQMVQDYVVDRECARRGIAVSAAEIDGNVAALRRAVAPATLEQVIARHHSSMAYVRNAFKQKIERARLVQGQVKPEPMVHCRAIVIKFAPPGMPQTLSGAKRSQAEAESLANDLLAQLKQGKDFAALAERYSEAVPNAPQGDYGILYDGMRETDPWITRSALTLGKGGVFPAPIKSGNSYVLLQGISTSGDHPAAENGVYTDALHLYQEQQAQFLAPKVVMDLIKQSHRTYCLNADALVAAGKPLPDAAATIDGHVIPMKDVVAKCLADEGPRAVDILVQNYLVDRECKRRGITVSDAQVEARVENLRRMIAPHTLDEGLAYRHLTLDALRYDFKQEIERASLVEDQVKPAKMVHCRAIVIPFAPPGQPLPASGMQSAAATQPIGSPPAGNAQPIAAQPAVDAQPPAAQTAGNAQSLAAQTAGDAQDTPAVSRTEAGARALMADIQAQLRQGKDFGDLAARYSEMRSQSGGDLGVLYPGMRDMDTALLGAGLALKRGETTPEVVKMVDGYALVQAVSASGDHPADEDALYTSALSAYKAQQASPLIPQAIVGLIKKSKVTYYVHA